MAGARESVNRVVRNEKGNLIALVQGAEPVFSPGVHVMALYGGRSPMVLYLSFDKRQGLFFGFIPKKSPNR
ncbi:hypothetical protein, partial [Oxalobacter paraformigenes]